jgi:hypothetical protein
MNKKRIFNRKSILKLINHCNFFLFFDQMIKKNEILFFYLNLILTEVKRKPIG